MAYFRAGYIRGGTENCALIANGDQFWNPPMLLPNEPARHKLLDLVGDLSLLAEPGHVGVPVGHVVAYKAGHELHAKFALKVKEAIEAGKATRVPAEMWAREEGPAANDAEVASMRKTEPTE
jgi:UDP-3-O-acyl-N-acetylglucosamine deacetylase